MRTFTSDVICENEYSLEDYQLSIQDTICSPSGTEEIKLEVCRERSDMRDTVSIHFYSYSPLEENVAVFAEEEIRFGPSQKCVQKIFFIQNNDVHILLNGDTSRKRPYTLKKTLLTDTNKWNMIIQIIMSS